MAVIQIRIITTFVLTFFARNLKNQIGTMTYFHRLAILP